MDVLVVVAAAAACCCCCCWHTIMIAVVSADVVSVAVVSVDAAAALHLYAAVKTT
jgi:hypothetical protein